MSSLIKFGPALRHQGGPGDLKRSLQTSVIQCFYTSLDGKGAPLLTRAENPPDPTSQTARLWEA